MTTLRQQVKTARKYYTCLDCGKVIELGQVYHTEVVKLDGLKTVETIRRCLKCYKRTDFFEGFY